MISIIHIHSKYSIDSNMDPKKILKLSGKKGIEMVAVTDHNTIKGGFEAKKYEKKYGVKVVVGAEIKTDCGDVIGLNLNQEVKPSDFYEVIEQIKKQDGIVVLPHPYRGHGSNIVNMAKAVDLVEIWNPRCSVKQNLLAAKLATTLNKVGIIGSDAHLYSELNNAIIMIDEESYAVKAILKLKYSSQWQIILSQIIRCTKTRNINDLLSAGMKFILRKIF